MNSTPCPNRRIATPHFTHRLAATNGLAEMQFKEPEISRVLEHMVTALDSLPEENTSAFQQALKTVPDLVETESNPVWFLRTEDWDATKAAQRLAMYWGLRQKTFQERAFLPMNMSSSGALGENGLKVLHTCCWSRLPDDEQSRPVLCYDMARLSGSANEIIAMETQCLFFCATLLAKESLVAQTHGFVTITIHSDKEAWKDSLTSQRDVLLKAIPSKLHSFHVCASTSQDISTKIELLDFKLLAAEPHTHCHVENTVREMIQTLQSWHLQARGLPACLGGTWACKGPTSRFCSQADSPELQELGNATEAGAKRAVEDEVEAGSQKAPRLNRCPSALDREQFEQERDIRNTRSLLESIQTLDQSENAAYMYAARWTPMLMEKEANPLWFLRVEDYDVERAAKRMARYWEVRKASFGDRAYLPMILTGDGALTADSVDVLMSRFLTRLPDDNSGRPVLLHDGSRLNDLDDKLLPSRGCCLFAFITLLAIDRVTAQTDGFVFLRMVSNACFQARNFDRQCQILMHTMPVKVHALHLCCVGPLSQQIRDASRMSTLVNVHVGESASDLLAQLQLFGLSEMGLPSCIGGIMEDDTYSSWLCRNISTARERIRSPAVCTATATSTIDSLEAQLVSQQKIQVKVATEFQGLKRTLDDIAEVERAGKGFGNDRLVRESCAFLKAWNNIASLHLDIPPESLQNCLIILCCVSVMRTPLPPPGNIGMAELRRFVAAFEDACGVMSGSVDGTSTTARPTLASVCDKELEENRVLNVIRDCFKSCKESAV